VVVGVTTQPLVGGVALAGGLPASRVLCFAILCKSTPDRWPTELHLRTDEAVAWELMRLLARPRCRAASGRLTHEWTHEPADSSLIESEYCMGAGGFEPPASRV
jgi:hypothetical protein